MLDALTQLGGGRQREGRRLADVRTEGGDSSGVITERGFDVVTVAIGDIGRLEPAGFDVVHCSWVVHRLADPKPAFQAMARAVRPGGQVVVQWRLTPDVGHAHRIDDVCLALHEEGLELLIADDDIEVGGADDYAARVIAHLTAPTPARDDAARPPRVRAFPLCVGILEVIAAQQLTPNIRRIVLTGDGVAELPVEEPGEIITLIWPAPGSDKILLPAHRRWRFPAGAEGQHARNLTIRALDRTRGRITIDFFLHSDHGRASRWARDATAGDIVGYGGPRMHWQTDPLADWTLLVGDETALPAIGAIAEQRPAGHRTIAVVEVERGSEEQALGGPGAVEAHWVHRGPRAPGCGTALLDAVRALDLPAEGRAQVWAAGESLLMRSIREHLRHERDIPRDAMNVLGYWKHTGDAAAS